MPSLCDINGGVYSPISNNTLKNPLIPLLRLNLRNRERKPSFIQSTSKFEMEGDNAMEMDVEAEEVMPRCLSSYVDQGSTESHRYYLSRRTMLELLKDRGYSIPDSEINLSLEEFRNIHGQKPDIDRLRISASLESNPSKKVSYFQS